MYTREMFEGNLVKRCIEISNVNVIKNQLDICRRGWGIGARGNVVTLSGPCVKEHWDVLAPIASGDEDVVLFVERDPDTAQIVLDGVKSIPSHKASFYKGDVFDCLFNCVYKCVKFVYFDFDFCKTDQGLVDEGLLSNLTRLAQSHLPSRTGFGLSLTTCLRKAKYGVLQFREMLERIFLTNGWSMKTSQYTTYKNGMRAAPMVTYLFFIRWAYK